MTAANIDEKRRQLIESVGKLSEPFHRFHNEYSTLREKVLEIRKRAELVADGPDCTTEELALAAAQAAAATASLADEAAALVHSATSATLMTANDFVTACEQALADCRNG